MDDRRARFDLILVCYRLPDAREAIRFCDRAFGAGLVGRRLLVLNRPSLLTQLDVDRHRWEIVQGSNVLAEFSGWQEGLGRLGPSGRAVVFANDSATSHRRFTRARRAAFVNALRAAEGAALVGFLDRGAGTYDYRIAGLGFDRWASTYCFALTSAALRLLDGKLYDTALVDGSVPGGHDEDAFFSGLSPDLEARLRYELFDGGWYGGARLDVENGRRLRLKARCIVSELLLSARCARLGIDLADPFARHPLLARIDSFECRVHRYALRKLKRPSFPVPALDSRTFPENRVS